MKRKVSALSHRYAAALRKHLQQGSRASLLRARRFGSQAAAMGLATLDVAKFHEGTLATLEAFGGRDGVLRQAEIFFTEAITPIEHLHGAVLKTHVRLHQLNKTLSRRTMDLAAANRSLKDGIARRKAAERALREGDERTRELLKESRRLQKHLRCLAHQVLLAQEAKRKKISHKLQDEIAQTLLGINVRLLTLKQEAAVKANGFKKDIASVQRLVEQSARSINRFAHELDVPQHL